jgi:hypothetical protein
VAEGAWVESYLECNGKRERFVNAGALHDTHTNHLTPASREKCLPHVESYQDPRLTLLFKTLLAYIPANQITTDPDLHILTDGKRPEPNEIESQTFMVKVPAHTQTLRLMSRSNRPCESGLPNDERLLGFCVDNLAAQSGDGAFKIMMAPHHTALRQGLHQATGAVYRWTQGDALLPNILLGDGLTDITLILKGRGLPRYHLGQKNIYIGQAILKV